MQEHGENGPFPAELLVSIFIHLNGQTLANCSQVCRQWNRIIDQFDQVIWPHACHHDFEEGTTGRTRRFWSLQFPSPSFLKSTKNKRTWQDMYRMTRNWYNGNVKAFYPTTTTAEPFQLDGKKACTVIGAPQEQGMFTSLTLAHDGRVVRSNPNYHTPTGSQTLIIQSPQTKQKFFLDSTSQEDIRTQSIVCHYTDPSSKWLVTGGLNGTVAVWNLTTKKLVRTWQGHRGRVLCISMSGEVVVSGGSDSVIRVWDLDDHEKRRRRGMIDISSYLSGRSDWYQGVGEIAVNGHLVACAPDASGPILVFSLLTGSLVYELRVPEDHRQPHHPLQHTEWNTEDITAFTRLCLTPFFLLTKGKIHHNNKSTIQLVPAKENIVLQRTQRKKQQSVGHLTKLSDSRDVNIPPVANMSPYQLYQYYASINHTAEQDDNNSLSMPTTSACINVWDLQTGKIAYRLVPTLLDNPHQNYSITDIRLSPDFSKVFASIEVRGSKHYKESLFCWDFNVRQRHHDNNDEKQNNLSEFDIVELDSMDPVLRKTGKSWVCFM